jgi:hypothetical protein
VFEDMNSMQRLLTIIDSGAKDLGNGNCDSESVITRVVRGLGFLRELFGMGRSLMPDQRHEVFSNLLTQQANLFFGAITNVLKNTSLSASTARVLASELLCIVSQSSPSQVHRYILAGPLPPAPPSHSNGMQSNRDPINYGSNCVLHIVILRLCDDSDDTVVDFLTETLRLLLETDRLEKIDKDRSLGLFYDHYIQWILVPIQSLERAIGNGETPIGTASRKAICDVLGVCVQCHSYRMKYFITRCSVLPKILFLLQHPFRHLHLASIKFIRTVIGAKDDFYYRHIVKFDILRPVFEKFSKCSKRDTMFVSAVLEMLEYIRLENISDLIVYIVEKYSLCFASPITSNMLDNLTIRYDQLRHGDAGALVSTDSQSVSVTSTLSKKHRHGINNGNSKYFDRDEDDDDAYFHNDSSEELSGSALHRDNLSTVENNKVSRPEKSYFESTKSTHSLVPAVQTTSMSSGSRIAHGLGSSDSRLPPSGNSLTLINDLYSDDDEENDSAFSATTSVSKFAENDVDLLEDIPPLPPLRSKFHLEDDDDDLTAQSSFFTHAVVGPSNLSLEHSTSSGDGISAGSSGISFSMRKRVCILICEILSYLL